MMYKIANLADYIVYRSLDQNKVLSSIKLYYISILLYLWNFKKFEKTPIRCGSRFLGSPDVEEHYPCGLGAMGIIRVPFAYPFEWKDFRTPVLSKGDNTYSEFDDDIDFMIDAITKHDEDYFNIVQLAEKIRTIYHDYGITIDALDSSRFTDPYKEDNYISYDEIEHALIKGVIRDTYKEYRELKDKRRREKLYGDIPSIQTTEKEVETAETTKMEKVSLKSIEDSAKRHKKSKEYRGEYSEYCAKTAGNLGLKVKYLDDCIDELFKTFKVIIDNDDYEKIQTPNSFDELIPNTELRFTIVLDPDKRKLNLTFMNIIGNISKQCGSGFYDILKYIEHDYEDPENRQLSQERNRIHIGNLNLFLPYSSFVGIMQEQGLEHAMSLADRKIGDEGVYEYLRKSMKDYGFFIYQSAEDNCIIKIYTLSEKVLC